MAFSIDSTLEEILADEEGKAVLEKLVPELLDRPQLERAMGMSLREIAPFVPEQLTVEALKAIAEGLGTPEINADSKFEAGDRAKVQDRPGWPGGYKIANWEGEIVEVKEDPAGYVIMKADKTGNDMAFPEGELDKI